MPEPLFSHGSAKALEIAKRFGWTSGPGSSPRLLATLFASGAAAADTFLLLFVVPKFHQIFQEMIPNQHLPAFVVFLLNSTAFLVAAAVLLLLVAVSIGYFVKNSSTVVWINGALAAMGILAGAVIVMSLFSQLVGTISMIGEP